MEVLTLTITLTVLAIASAILAIRYRSWLSGNRGPLLLTAATAEDRLTARQVAPLAEVELHQRAPRQAAGPVRRQHHAQEARLEDGDARAQGVARADLRHAPDVARAVGVDEVEGHRQAVRGAGSQVHRAGVEDGAADRTGRSRTRPRSRRCIS